MAGNFCQTVRLRRFSGYFYTRPVPNGSKWIRSENRIGWAFCLHGTVLEPVRNGSKTGPAFLQVRFWIHSDPFRTGSRKVTWKQKSIRTGSFRNGPGPVPCKHSLSFWGYHKLLLACERNIPFFGVAIPCNCLFYFCFSSGKLVTFMVSLQFSEFPVLALGISYHCRYARFRYIQLYTYKCMSQRYFDKLH